MNPRENLDEELFRLEQRIARRADELSRQYGVDRSNALEHWRQAEREVWQDEAPELLAVSPDI
ncbi:MAG: hypothetical protein Q7S40_22630 [Opitutaceae bacterium]|nr:hypothetical protein [Opitutaceae bacterium]